ncbi:MAG: ABC transporter ATP-binding protein [Candidatus Omnitrophota bacterium]
MILQINDLKTSYFKDQKETKAVDGVRLKIPKGCIFALVGESGCGKSTLGLSITNLIGPKDGRVVSGSVVFEGKNILRISADELRDIRGKSISYIFQEPATSLNPVFSIGEQIKEALLVHRIVRTREEAKIKAMASLKEARLDNPERVFKSYPHQLSGGMKQRAMIAMAISTRPKLLIADEPTTALDVDTESEILQLLSDLREEMSLSILIITHDIRLVRRFADRAAVMYNGKIVEVEETAKLFEKPKHAYTQMLLDSMPERLKL